MKNYIPYIIILIFTTGLFGQSNPRITINETQAQLGLQSLAIKVDVVGNIATTTFDMTFFNPEDRVLEGELSFPLGQNQDVNYFALELNGVLREAVIVEKEKGRVAFENTVRQQIDPALLEKTQGNNYKARIYPIPARGTKRVVLAYQQELIFSGNGHILELPLDFKDRLKKFDLEVKVFKQIIQPKMEMGELSNFEFKNWEENFIAKTSKVNYIPNTFLKIDIPTGTINEKLIRSEDYFYFYQRLEPKSRIKSKPKNITIYWDSSLSLQYRDIESELSLLDSYIRYLSNITIDLVIFSNDVIHREKFSISDGNWDSLRDLLKTITYDGGTSYNALNFENKKSDEYLLFTDGMHNLGKIKKKSNRPVYIINSVSKSDHDFLEQFSVSSGGNYLNLNRLSSEKAIHLLKHEAFRFLGYSNSTSKDIELYPNGIKNITNDFSIAGNKINGGEKITLNYGYGNKVTYTKEIIIPNNSYKSQYPRSFWAQKKLRELSINAEENKDQIIKHSKRHQLISSFTSLIVLDRVEDYVRYEIEPPVELLQEYKSLLKKKRSENFNSKEYLAELKEDIDDSFEEIKKWSTAKFDEKKSKNEIENSSQSEDLSDINSTQNINLDTEVNPELPIVRGRVVSSSQPLPGVNIFVKGSNDGVISDFDGNYAINAQEGDILVFTFIGMHTVEKSIEENVLDVEMEETIENLEELVVVGYGTSNNMLSGRVAGVEITEENDDSVVRIRGASSISSENSPMYIVDGVLVEEQEFNSNDIEEMYVLKSEQATGLYGARASNGVVVINTKQGLKDNYDEISEFEDLIEEKLELKPWTPNADYILELKKEQSIKEAYAKYIFLRKDFLNNPSFFMDVSEFFESKGDKELALMILTNIAEIDIDNYELLRALAYKLEYYQEFDLAEYIYEKILELRPEDIQSYRDLALIYQEVGKYQKSLDLLYRIVNGEFLEKDEERRFVGIEQIAFVELNNLIVRHGSSLNLNAIDKKYIKSINLDLRVVIDWNHNDTDIDLWVKEPTGELCYYKHTKTKIGGRISEDMTEGFGPEEYLLGETVEGEYIFSIDYYSDNVQKISGPAFLKISIFRNYGRKNQTKEVLVHKLEREEEDQLEVGKLVVK